MEYVIKKEHITYRIKCSAFIDRVEIDYVEAKVKDKGRYHEFHVSKKGELEVFDEGVDDSMYFNRMLKKEPLTDKDTLPYRLKFWKSLKPKI